MAGYEVVMQTDTYATNADMKSGSASDHFDKAVMFEFSHTTGYMYYKIEVTQWWYTNRAFINEIALWGSLTGDGHMVHAGWAEGSATAELQAGDKVSVHVKGNLRCNSEYPAQFSGRN